MPFCHLFCQRKGIMAEHIDMSVTKRGKACDIFIIKYFALRPKMIQRSLHIDGVPQHYCVSHQPQRTKLIFLAVAISLPYFTFLTMTNCSGDSVAYYSGTLSAGAAHAADIYLPASAMPAPAHTSGLYPY
jgi:hypothetical protein